MNIHGLKTKRLKITKKIRRLREKNVHVDHLLIARRRLTNKIKKLKTDKQKKKF